MKRHIDRDLSPRNKRSRNIISPEMDMYRYERFTDYDRYDRGDIRRSISPKLDRFLPEQDLYNRDMRPQQDDCYRSLCVSNLHQKANDKTVEDILKKEFKQYGDFNVKFATYNGERVAYMNFRYPEHAREARYGTPKLYIYDRPVRIQPMYGSSRRRSPSPEYHRAGNRSGGSMPGHIIPPVERFVDRRDIPHDSSPHSHDASDYGGRKRDGKFPYHLDHLDPEDDNNATRTLFVGNLSFDITEEDIRDVFEKYGFVEDIDIKRPNKGSGNAYSFIRYTNLDMAHRAKVDMSGRYVKSFQCKIGYGKVTPTRCLWVGGLGPWIQYDLLERKFDHFGIIEKIEWPQGKNYAYVLYESVDAAVRACNEMRGYPLGGTDKRIRVDYGDAEHIHNDPSVRRKPQQVFDRDQSEGHRNQRPTHDRFHNSGDVNTGRHRNNSEYASSRGSTAPRRASHDEPLTLETASNVHDLANCLPSVWNGLFFLKTSNFGCRMHILRGEEKLVDQFMKRGGTNDLTQLRITQRMKLDPIKLDDVSQRIQAAGNSGFCVMLAMPAMVPSPPVEESNGTTQPQRPLKNLITYLRSKESAGVVFLNNNQGGSDSFTLHAFPPCEFAMNLLTQRAAKLSQDVNKDDHLVVLLIRSSESG